MCGLLVVIIATLCIIASATHVTTLQRRLLGLADAAATASLEAFELTPVPPKAAGGVSPAAGVGQGMVITQPRAEAAVRTFLRQSGNQGSLEHFRVVSVAVAGDGVTVTVVLRARVRPGLTAGLLPAFVDVEARGRARLSLSR